MCGLKNYPGSLLPGYLLTCSRLVCEISEQFFIRYVQNVRLIRKYF